jgi:hypothetical protein
MSVFSGISSSLGVSFLDVAKIGFCIAVVGSLQVPLQCEYTCEIMCDEKLVYIEISIAK